MAGFARLLVAAGAGWLAMHSIGALPALFMAMALALVVFGTTLATAIRFTSHRKE